MSLDEDISLAELAHKLASKASDAADEHYFSFAEPTPEAVKLQAQAERERQRTFAALQELRFRKAWG